MLARLEVHWAILRKSIEVEDPGCDYLPASLVPSVSEGDDRDRDLAEIDQDGFAFAIDPRDQVFFNTRTCMVPRRDHRLQLVLRNGHVFIRKSQLPRDKVSFSHRILLWLHFGFYVECASLLRLRGLPFVPQVTRIDLSNAAVEMEYIWGVDIRRLLAGGADTVDYPEVLRRFTSVLDGSKDPLSAEVTELILDVARRGVVHRDLSAANFIRGKNSHRLYVIDFNLVYLSRVPGWWAHARQLSRRLQTSGNWRTANLCEAESQKSSL